MATNAKQLMRGPSPSCLRDVYRPRCYRIGPSTSTRSLASSAPRRQVQQQLSRSPKDLMEQVENRQSRRVELKNITAGKIVDDLGLIPQTFIRPPSSGMPALFGKSWKTRLWVEWRWLRTRVENFFTILYFVKWSQRKNPKSKRHRLGLSSRQSTALDLHNTFYTCLAAGSLRDLRPILCGGLAEKARTQISQREECQLPPQSWTRAKFSSPISLPFHSRLLFWPLTSLVPFTQAKIMSDRAIALPIGNSNSFVRQCVVRISSLQELDQNDGTPTSYTAAILTEYIVLQQMQINLDGGESSSESSSPTTTSWKLWGTVGPTSIAEMEKMISNGKDDVKESRASWSDRIKNMVSTKLT